MSVSDAMAAHARRQEELKNEQSGATSPLSQVRQPTIPPNKKARDEESYGGQGARPTLQSITLRTAPFLTLNR